MVKLGKGVKIIGDYCFRGAENLEVIEIPNNVESLGFEAFSDCKNLKTVVIGNGLRGFGGWCFDGCEELTIIVPEGITIPKSALGDCNPKIIVLNEEQMRKYKRRDTKIPETTALKKSIKDDKNSNEGEKSSWENISDDIKELEEKVRKIYYLKQTTLANSYKARVDELRRKYTEVLNSEDIIFGSDMDSQILDELFALKKELNEYLNGKGKEIENKQTRERYNRNIGEITTGSDEKSTEELWAGVRKIAGQLKIDCERNPRLEVEQINKVIAKQVLRILRIQAKRGEEIDLPKAEELCSKEDLLCTIKDKLIEMAGYEKSVEKKDELFEKSRYLEEESLKDPEIWKMLTGVQEVKFIGEKKEIEIKKPRFCFPQIKYEGLGLEKIPWLSVYTLWKDIDEDTGENIYVKKYGRFPRDFGDNNWRVEKIEINGVQEVKYYDCEKYKNLKKVIFGDDVEKLDKMAFTNNKHLKEVELGNGVKEIGYHCFRGCCIETIFIPNNVEILEHSHIPGYKNIGNGEPEFGVFDNGPFDDTPAWENGNVIISDNTQINHDFSIFTLGEIDPETGERKNVRRVLGFISDFQKYSDQVLEIEINDVKKIIWSYHLEHYPNLEKVVLGKNVKYIGECAFEGCKKLECIEMNDSIEEIGKQAFCNSGIKKIIIPKSVKKIGEGAFADCEKLEEVIIARGIKIPPMCFARNSSLTKIGIVSMTVPDISYIANDAFFECQNNIVIHGRY